MCVCGHVTPQPTEAEDEELRALRELESSMAV